jgi:hypothetical protein
VAVSRGLRRLLRVRELEEEQCRLALEAASSDLNKLRAALEAAIERGRRGSRLISASAGSLESTDRLAGIQEIRTGDRFAEILMPRIAEQEKQVAARREEFMVKRIERRQAETLIEATEAQDAIEEGRRNQQGLDAWYSNKLYREGVQQEPSSARAAEEDRPARHIKKQNTGDLEKTSTD